MSGYEAEKEKAASEPQPAPKRQRGQDIQTLTVKGNFQTNMTVSLDMTGIGDLDSEDEVVVYAATAASPTTRRTGTNEQRGNWAPPPTSNWPPTALAAGDWAAGSNYYVQVSARTGTTWTVWQGHTSGAAGNDRSIALGQQTFN